MRILLAAALLCGCHTASALDPDAQVETGDGLHADGHVQHPDARPPDALVCTAHTHACTTGCCRDVAAIAVGGINSCAIFADDRSVACWGGGAQIGDGHSFARFTPTAVS